MFSTSANSASASGEVMEAKMDGFLIPALMIAIAIGAAIYIKHSGRNADS